MDKDEELVKVHVDLPAHWATGGESLWALPLGDNLYELRNVPFYAYGLNFLDVVRAVPESTDLKPSVISLEKSRGHRTLRVLFEDCVEGSKRKEYLSSLKQFQASYENANGHLYAIDIEQDGNYPAVCDQLAE